MVKEAFEKWVATDGLSLAREVPAAAMLDEFMFKTFQAGWNAARAEARSDAADATGGRSILEDPDFLALRKTSGGYGS